MIPALHGDRASMLQTVLPEDPEDGQVITMPEGQTVGGANVINFERGGKLLGSVSQVAPVYNASGKYEATRVASCSKIRAGDVIHVRGWQFNYISLKFTEGFGWTGYQTDNTPIPLMDKHMKVLDTFIVGAHAPGCYLYEKVCLQLIREGEETHAKNPSNPSTTTSRNSTPPSSGPSSSGGRSGSAPRTDPTSGSCSNVSRKPTFIDVPDGATFESVKESDTGG